MSVTNNDFLREKLTNFVNFLTACLHKRLNNVRFAEFKNKIDELRTCDTAHFIMYVTTDVAPYKSNPKAYINKLLLQSQIENAELSAEEMDKLVRYVQCFIECVEQ